MDLTPKQTVHELNKYIIGQDEAKRAVAIALRNRYRRAQLSPELREEVTPKNIIMKGPTGVGKTEIARRLAKLVKAPFLKVEATKYTEVGYVGRDVESMIRDLAECAIRLVKEEKTQEVSYKAMAIAERRIAKVLAEIKKDERGEFSREVFENNLVDDIHAGKYDSTMIEIEVADNPKPLELSPGQGAAIDLGSVFGSLGMNRKKKRRISVREARNLLMAEGGGKVIGKDTVQTEARSLLTI